MMELCENFYFFHIGTSSLRLYKFIIRLTLIKVQRTCPEKEEYNNIKMTLWGAVWISAVYAIPEQYVFYI